MILVPYIWYHIYCTIYQMCIVPSPQQHFIGSYIGSSIGSYIGSHIGSFLHALLCDRSGLPARHNLSALQVLTLRLLARKRGSLAKA